MNVGGVQCNFANHTNFANVFAPKKSKVGTHVLQSLAACTCILCLICCCRVIHLDDIANKSCVCMPVGDCCTSEHSEGGCWRAEESG